MNIPALWHEFWTRRLGHPECGRTVSLIETLWKPWSVYKKPAVPEGRVYEPCIPERVSREIACFARKHGVDRVVLFGSRVRGTNEKRSDIDLAVSGGNFDGFYWDIQENIPSMLTFDLVDASSGISGELADEIRKDGVTIYEKA